MARTARFSVDLTEFEEDINQIAEDEGRTKANTIQRLIKEAIAARKEKANK
ncbi:MAG: hypothetical protein KME60_03195 [Cyanomargarita calcarea GSE-NOS-MK-12-04C]|jgi:predicted DNA-binding protein|uniref:Uncharacterized protein n=1 Tax=Cyanomargarita calcarea GSE-NOS-MK-12-04C TaxID=2839659 RepID=A0A951URN8_9CYAN|nr:hypothetical protein [Cyanomargarita calcarea GSE-NOS-MK-12-04C]